MLKSRRTFPPQGFWWYQSQTNWPAQPAAEFAGKTFEEAVRHIIRHRESNPRFNLPTDFDTVADELDAFTTLRLQRDPKAKDYIVEGDELKKSIPRLPAQPAGAKGNVAGVSSWLKNTVAGIGLYAEWFGNNNDPVSKELAEKRAAVCVGCPFNEQNLSLSERFNEAAAGEIMKIMEVLHHMDLHTSKDAELGVCSVCDCPLKAKLWCDLKLVTGHIRPEAQAQLPSFCWIKTESN